MSISSKFIILGCGHSESNELFNNNAAILSPQGRLLIDAGHTIKPALHAQGLGVPDVDAVFITHVHGDHVFGLERLAYESKFKFKTRIKLYLHETLYDDLWERTLKGSMGSHGDGAAQLEDYFDVIPVFGNSLNVYGHHLHLFQNRHTPGKPSFGLTIDNKIFYSGDTTAIPDIISSLPFETGFHDVTLSAFNPVHAPLQSLIDNYPAQIRKKLYLMSYEDHWREHVSEVEQHFRGFAKQGMTIDL